jgi:hypothetical protein
VSTPIRAGDAERERAARLIREACAEGRLEIEELDARLDAVYAARGVDELRAVVADIPGPASAPTEGARLWWPGVAPFHVERRLAREPSECYAAALRTIVPRMVMSGFDLHAEVPPRRLSFASDEGLRVTVLLHAAPGGGTDLAAFGEAPRRVRKAFATDRTSTSDTSPISGRVAG